MPGVESETEPMSQWNDPQLWQALLDGAGCPIRTRGVPLHVIARMECSWLTLSDETPSVWPHQATNGRRTTAFLRPNRNESVRQCLFE
ncbi:hypothetical protein D7Y15_35775 [Corallococcus sp. AB030]|nr:hypothetical protein D7Y15_35775 [Corallococcus sp. AB030]